MTHTYKITGMSCDDCRTKVENALNTIEGISAVVTLDPMEATITMEKHVPTGKLQEALSTAGNYSIEMTHHPIHDAQGNHPHHNEDNHSHSQQHEATKPASHQHPQTTADKPLSVNSTGKYYCSMYCEGDKLYDKPGNCPVCGMNLEKVPELT